VSIYGKTVCFRAPFCNEVAQKKLVFCVEKPIQSCAALVHLHGSPEGEICRLAPGLEKERHVEAPAVLRRGHTGESFKVLYKFMAVLSVFQHGTTKYSHLVGTHMSCVASLSSSLFHHLLSLPMTGKIYVNSWKS